MTQAEAAFFLSNEPLPPGEHTISRDIYYEEVERTRGGDEPETMDRKRKIRAGKITLNTDSIQLFTIPPQSQDALPSLAPDRTRWDLYLVVIPFTLHPALRPYHYELIELAIHLETPETAALDLFPKNILTSEDGKKGYMLSRHGRFQQTDDPEHDLGRALRFASLDPTIRAFGTGEQNFYWQYSIAAQKNAAESNNVLLVLRVPRGAQLVRGNISYKISLKRPLFGRWKAEPAQADPYSFQWRLGQLPPFFSPATPIQAKTNSSPEVELRQTSSATTSPHFDVFLVCAVEDEAKALRNIIERFGEASFKQDSSRVLKRDYWHTTIKNNANEPISLQITVQPRYGSTDTATLLSGFLRESSPFFAGMTGILAGDPGETVLGDIIIAERAFSYEEGKMVSDEEGKKKLIRDTMTWQAKNEVLSALHHFAWQTLDVAALKRPPSRRQQRDWLLSRLEQTANHTLLEIPERQRNSFAPQWREICQQLQQGPSPLLTANGTLTPAALAPRSPFEIFPYKDPKQPKVHTAPVATGAAVRADNPWPLLRETTRKVLGAEMEAEAFYRVAAEFSNVTSLFVKGVSDYADSEKDDSYREYASQISALYMLRFIQAFVTSQRFPDLGQ